MVNFPYTASGAGDSATNGEYTEAGEISGAPYGYNGVRYVRYFGPQWAVVSNLTTEPAIIYESSAGDAENFPLTGWASAGGAEPAPTWTGSSSGFGDMIGFLFG